MSFSKTLNRSHVYRGFTSIMLKNHMALADKYFCNLTNGVSDRCYKSIETKIVRLVQIA